MTPKCPRCGAATDLTPNNRWRPFCCERCQIIDLGAWADGSYRVPVHKAEPLASEGAGHPHESNLRIVHSAETPGETDED
jgi:uncharacterized protein